MAKNDNLTDFLTDVADAIRAKKGTTAKINPQDFSAEIASIEGGGSSSVVIMTEGDVHFYDYDGTLLYAYTKEEFAGLTEMPPLPTQSGLTCQGWNYNLDDAKAYVSEYGKLDIGATYITDDGKTRLYITIAAKGRQDVPLYFSQTVASGVTIDWGDGSATETLSGSGNVNTTHHYDNIGDYVISLDVADGCTLGLGHNSDSYCIIGSTGNSRKVYCNMLQAVEIGSSVTSIATYAFYGCYGMANVVIPECITSIATYAFYNCYSLDSVVIPNSVKSIGHYAFNGCYSLDSVVIPNSVTSIGDRALCNCSSLDSVVIPSSVKSIGNYAFNGCYSLSSIAIPSSVTSIGTYAFNGCYSLASVVIPYSIKSIGNYVFSNCYALANVVISSGVTSFGNRAFYNCYSLANVVIPDSVTSIDAYAFYDCHGMAFYDFRASKSVPTLSNTNAFNNIPSDCKIVVPDALYDTWIAVTNWSTLASSIVKASEYNV